MSSVILNFISRHFFPFLWHDFFFFYKCTTSQSSGKLVWSSQLPFSQQALGEWHGVRGYPLQCTAAHALPRGKGGIWKLCKPLPLDIREWGQMAALLGPPCPGWCRVWVAGMASPGRPQLALLQTSAPAFLVDTRDLFSNQEKGQGLGGATATSSLFLLQRLRETTLSSKSYVWLPTLSRLNPGNVNWR